MCNACGRAEQMQVRGLGVEARIVYAEESGVR